MTISCLFLLLVIIQDVSGNITLNPVIPETNQKLTISCNLSGEGRFWLITGIGQVICAASRCSPAEVPQWGYTFYADNNKIEVIIQSLNRSRDERDWNCSGGNENYKISLQIYTIPQGLELTQAPNDTIDLSVSSATLQCRTTSCAYPEPTIEWLYKTQPTSTIYEAYTATIPSVTQVQCASLEKNYTSSLYLAKNTTWSDNSDTTVTFSCRIGYTDPSKNIIAASSRTVKYAVRVTEAVLQQDNQNITDTLNVTSGEPVNLTCVTGTSRPAPIIDWYIGSQWKGIGTSLIFIPSNSDHNQTVFCQVYNIMPNLKVDSNKSKLFVRVRITEAVLQQNNQNITDTLNVTTGEQVNLSCVTGTSRPAPTVEWYIGSQLKGSGASLTFIASNADHNQRVFCQVYNIMPNLKVDSNKLRLFVRVNVSIVTLEGSRNGTAVFYEGFSKILKCISSPSRPVPTITWWLGNIQLTDNIINTNVSDINELYVLISEITLILLRNNSNQKIHCEGSISAQGTPAVSTQVNADVWYAPDVLVHLSGSTVVNSTVLLMCTPLGEPSQYTFHQWVHKVGETEIRRLTGTNAANTSILTLSDISTEDMGTYTCIVDNSITGLDGQINQRGHTDIFVYGPPFIENKNLVFIGVVNKSARLEIPFYSNPASRTIKFYRGSNTVEVTNASDTLIFVSSFLNTMTFYGKEVLINGQIAVLHFRAVKRTDFGEYSAVLFNDIGSTSRSIVFSSGEPETPANFRITDVQEKQVTLQWLSGDHKGFDQTFVIQISMDNITWINASLISAGKKEGWFSATITELKSNTAYYFRLYSFNVNGRSDFADINFSTKTFKECASSFDIGVSLGIGFGGFFLGIIGTISVITMRKRMIATPKYSSTRETDTSTEMHNYANTRVNSSPAPSHYEELHQDKMEKNVYDHI